MFWTPFVLQGHGVSASGRAVFLWAQQQAAAVIEFFSRVPATSVAIRAINSSKRNGSSAAASSEPVASIEKRLARFF